MNGGSGFRSSRSPVGRRRRISYSRSRSRSRGRYDRSRSRSRSNSRRGPGHSSGAHRTGDQANPEPNKCLGVFGLSLRTTERDLREVFSRYGAIDEVTVVIDAQTGRSRGFSFIYFENLDDARIAKEESNGMEIDGRRIRVDFSITQRAHTPTPGIYMGKSSMEGKYRGSRNRNNYDGYRDRGYDRGDRGYERSDHRRGWDERDRNRSPSPGFRKSSRRHHSRSRSYSPRKY